MPYSTTPNDGSDMTGLMGEKIATEALAQRVASFLTPEFARIELDYSAAGPVGQAKIRAVRADGSHTSFPRTQVHDTVASLRSAMYRPGTGTWFSMSMTVSAAGAVDASFNYDDLPPTSFDFASDAYAADLVKFPRDPAHTPDWLSEQLAADRKEQESR